jgi:hypothetical protein
VKSRENLSWAPGHKGLVVTLMKVKGGASMSLEFTMEISTIEITKWNAFLNRAVVTASGHIR